MLFPNSNDSLYIMLLVMIQPPKQIGKVYLQKFRIVYMKKQIYT